MESYNLKTASNYVNNLLLARGLLRDGKQIELARPSKGEGGSEATMAVVINLIHDLILRRDSEQQHREGLATTLRALQIETSASAAALQKMRSANEDLRRQLALAQAAERSARTAHTHAEATTRSLREEGLRLKQSVQQIRTMCANDIRKRDVQIQRLKGHLAEQQRGNRAQLIGASVVISPGFNSGVNASTSNGVKRGTATLLGPDGQRSHQNGSLMPNDPGYSLRQETVEFLTQLGQSLSDENDALIAIVRNTLSSLRGFQELSGLNSDSGSTQFKGGRRTEPQQHEPQGISESHEELARDVQQALADMQSILTSPNYVPLEEVNTRDEEIQRLRTGWDKMEARWQEAVTLMHDWKRRMLEGETLSIDELRAGLAQSPTYDPSDNDFEIIQSDNADQEELTEQNLEGILVADGSDDVDLPEEPRLLGQIEEQKPESPTYQEIKKHTSKRPLKEASGNRQYRSTPARLNSSRQQSVLGSTKLLRAGSTFVDENVEDSAVDVLPTAYKTLDSPKQREVVRAASALNTQKETMSSTRRVRFSTSVLAATPDLDQSPCASPATESRSPHTIVMTRTLAATPLLGKRGERSKGKRRPTLSRPSPSDRCLRSPGADDTALLSPCHGKVHDLASPSVGIVSSPSRLSTARLPAHQQHTVIPSPVSPFRANDGTSIDPFLRTPLTYHYIDPLQSLKRHSSPTRHDDEPSPKMSVQEKLNLAAAEAEAAAVAAGLTLDDVEVRVDLGTFETEALPAEVVSPAARANTTKRNRKSAIGIKGRATRRRKSTLTPEELERLMFD